MALTGAYNPMTPGYGKRTQRHQGAKAQRARAIKGVASCFGVFRQTMKNQRHNLSRRQLLGGGAAAIVTAALEGPPALVAQQRPGAPANAMDELVLINGRIHTMD